MDRVKEHIDVLIVGGGIHGMHIFHLLSQQFGGSLNIKVADPNPEPLHNWQHCTSNTGMKFLRSPGVHHIDLDPFSLQQFCKYHKKENQRVHISPNNRPALSLFNKHSQKVISSYSLQNYWLQTNIKDIDLSKKGAIVQTDNEVFLAKHVILAIGSGKQLTIPGWAHELQSNQFPIHHLYSLDFSFESLKPGFHTVIIGGGMGAVQSFVKLAKTHQQKCTLITPSAIKVSNYDIAPGWMGPKYLYRFQNEKSFQKRRGMIKSARQTGTITPEVSTDLKRVLRLPHTNHIVSKITKAEMFGSDNAYLTTKNEDPVFCDQIVLGTGFDSVINNELIQKLKDSHSLRCAECGHPIIDPFLRWHPKLTVTGELAELELGPAAKNIIGARHAGERIQLFASNEIKKA